MVLNSCALIGFYLLIHADISPHSRASKAKAWIRGAGYALVSLALGLLVFAPHPSWPLAPASAAKGSSDLPLAEALRIALVVLALVSAILLVWSVFLEISYHRRRLGLDVEATVREGSYSLCRHPGFWWFSFLAVSVGFLRGMDLYFFTVSLMIGLDLLLIVIQDKYAFPRLFSGYDAYRKEVPFLLPRLFPRRAKPR